MKAKEAWINETLESLSGIRPVPFDRDLFPEIEEKLLRKPETVEMLRKPVFWTIAASLAFLITLNVMGLMLATQKTTITDASRAVVVDYLEYLTPIKL